ncbi:uncharacterized protein Tco025E_09951, partial [Trypanosoma conorhini]
DDDSDAETVTSPEDASVGAGRTPPTSQSPASRQRGSALKAHVTCSSKYHARYSAPDKHASRECPFCTVCHMMEALFNGYTRTCCWGHGPTERRIAFHLKHHPRVHAAALERLASWRQGLPLPPSDGVV